MALAVAVALAFWLTGIGADLERGLHVWRDGLRSRPAVGRLTLVEIDAKSLTALHRWPWPRGLHAKAIDALRRAGAQTIAFDVDFSAPSDPVQDQTLSRAIAASDVPVILPTFRQPASESGKGIVENLPIPSLRRGALLASVNIFADRDGLVRSYPYGVMTGGVPRPSIGALLANAGGGNGSAFPLDGAIQPSTVPRISFVDLIQGRIAPHALRGRNVLIGATAIELGDRYPVPGHGVISGALIQLLAAETLLQGSSPVDQGPAVPILLLLCVLPFAIRSRGRLRAAVLSATGGALITLPLITETMKLGTFEIIPAVAGLIAATVAAAVTSAVQARREARLVDLDTGLPNHRSLRDLLIARPTGAVTVVRIANHGDVVGVLGQSNAAELVRRVANRLAFVSEMPVHRVEDSALAWITMSDDPEEHIRRIDAAAAMLRAPFEVAGRQIDLVFGFGLAELSTGDDVAGQAIMAADRAVARGARWDRHSADLGRESDWRLGLAAELDKAMAAGDITVAYQPKYDIRLGRIGAAEALVRWNHPERGTIPPDAFIPVLEETGRIADLTRYVLERALTDQACWADEGARLGVAVNVSALLPADPQFAKQVEEMLGRYPSGTGMLTLEVTESATMSDPDAAIASLERLVGLGVALSIDDYGTGHSTLSYLKRLPAREIKIDKGFILGLEASRSDQAMVRSTIALAHELGFKVVAEGVESAASLTLLESFGCDIAQGWHIGRPMPSRQFVALAKAPVRQAA